MLWDRGTWQPKDDPVAGYAKGHLKFKLDGEKLKGGWTLVRTRGSKYGGKTGDQAWLLIKEQDAVCARRRAVDRRRRAQQRDDRPQHGRDRNARDRTSGNRSCP